MHRVSQNSNILTMANKEKKKTIHSLWTPCNQSHRSVLIVVAGVKGLIEPHEGVAAAHYTAIVGLAIPSQNTFSHTYTHKQISFSVATATAYFPCQLQSCFYGDTYTEKILCSTARDQMAVNCKSHMEWLYCSD